MIAMYEETICVLQSAAEKARQESNEENQSLFTIAADSIRLLSNRLSRLEHENESQLFGIEYVQGYRNALQDAILTIDSIQDDLKVHKVKQSEKTYHQILECMLNNRVALRESNTAFIRCKLGGGFELYDSKWRYEA